MELPDPDRRPVDWRSIALRTFLASVAANALIAIVVILGGGGDHQDEILGTSLILTGMTIAVIANASAYAARRLGALPIGAGLAVVATAAMGIVAVWAQVDSDDFLNWLGTLLAVGLAGTYAGLIASPALAPRIVWLRWSAAGVAGLLAIATIGAIWGEDPLPGEGYAVLSVLLAALTIVVPVLSRHGRRARATGALHVSVGYCPQCGAGVAPPAGGTVACESCGGTSAVTVLRRGASTTGHVAD